MRTDNDPGQVGLPFIWACKLPAPSARKEIPMRENSFSSHDWANVAVCDQEKRVTPLPLVSLNAVENSSSCDKKRCSFIMLHLKIIYVGMAQKRIIQQLKEQENIGKMEK